ncbi:MAG: non-homologous end-joining DNA ligase [Myxococcota bacterium]
MPISAARLIDELGDVREATPLETPPLGAYSYELEYDGLRARAFKRGKQLRLIDRRARDTSAAFPSLVKALRRALAGHDVVLDGVVVATDERGVPSRERLDRRAPPISYVLFDVLWLDGTDLRAEPLESRRAALDELLGAPAAPLVRSIALQQDVQKLLKVTCDSGFTALIGKRLGSPYRAGHSLDWVRLQCEPRPSASTTPTIKHKQEDASVPVVAGIRLSHATRVLKPLPLNKFELARYYEAVSEWMLPHVQQRPLTLMRWAEGKATEKGGVYLRHRRAWGPAVLARAQIREQRKLGEYLYVTNAAGLVALAQMDILEVHTWNSIVDDVEHPNRIVFDLDPGPAVAWREVVSAARDLRTLLKSVGLESFLKTTGGKGLHLLVPLLPEHDWATCHAAARTIAEQFAQSDSKRFTTNVQKAERKHKILVDYLRNSRGNTSVAAYSTRANASATISTPIDWDELGSTPINQAFTVQTLPPRLQALRVDPWARYWKMQQRLLRRRAP